ncbi:hypothetical protein [Micromonospora matsumotoense]|uniref:hypothetical protein n=1 Tax=Micromonospora matsumotoense TaxID=121616 RepID=UPI003408BAA8
MSKSKTRSLPPLFALVTAANLAATGVTSPALASSAEPRSALSDVTPTTSSGDVQPRVVGGDVIRHDSIQGLVVAKGLSFSPNGQGGNCDVWNKNGGSAYSYLDSNNNCTTASMNGQTYSWTLWNDTDVFTMQNQSYRVQSRDGSWRSVGANVYTRIHDNENAHCYQESDGVNCYVQLG